MNKQEIRKEIKAKRSMMGELEVVAYSKIIENRLLAEKVFQDAECIFAYIDCKNEVSTRNIISAALKQGKRVAVPKVMGADMGFYYIKSFGDLKKGYAGIYEPEVANESNYAKDTKGLCIVPGVAFDKDMNRIGYGGGFYDKFFDAYPEMYRCALGFDFQIVDKIDTESFDQKMDMIVTPSGILKS
ncbi:MAG: 5-formyltetrahydrofolate cyclo-ligase [Lachnospiraceae bacterium]|nr:5-formyltetrahydrofolate cyclo-ligase [Lachnospiraceae bacterium]